MNTPALYVGDIPFYDTPAEVEGSPYWVDHWADINGYKIGLQIKPQSYQSASISIYMGKAKSSEENGHKRFSQDFGGKVFVVPREKGVISKRLENQILAYRDLLMSLPPKG